MKRLLSILALSAAVAAAGYFWLQQASTSGQPEAAKLGTTEQCRSYTGLPPGWPAEPHAGMQRLEGGSFILGSKRGYPDEQPERPETVAGFWIDRTEVTNAQFAAFVAATGHVSSAEQGGGAAVFIKPEEVTGIQPGSWWKLKPGADWRHPEGPGSSIDGRANEPVVNVSYADAQAYAKWLGHELPSEREWEYAAKAGRSNEASDSSLRDAQHKPLANFWQGMFPVYDGAEDGYSGRAPVGCFPANPSGLYDMVGNVWEWTADREGSTTPVQQVIKGGSFLCSSDYCTRARASSRQPQEADLPTSHLGFRTIRRP